MRRHAHEIAWSALMGVVLAFVVAIASALLLGPSSRTARAGTFSAPDLDGTYWSYPYAGVDITFVNWTERIDIEHMRQLAADASANWIDRLPYFLPLVGPRKLGDAYSQFHSLTTMHIGAGWPARMLWAEVEMPFQHITAYGSVWAPGRLRGGVPWLRNGTYLARPTHVIPLRPVAAPIALNTVFWGGCVWALRFAPLHARRVLRLRRGLCPACGYDLAGSLGACPECGRGVARSAAAGSVAHTKP